MTEIKDLIFIFLHISDMWFAGIPGAAGVGREGRVVVAPQAHDTNINHRIHFLISLLFKSAALLDWFFGESHLSLPGPLQLPLLVTYLYF